MKWAVVRDGFDALCARYNGGRLPAAAHVGDAPLTGRDAGWVRAQRGHTHARVTLQVYAQPIQRQRVDAGLGWSLMRFSDEPEEWPGPGHRGG